MKRLETARPQLAGNLMTPETTLRLKSLSAADVSDEQDIPSEGSYSDMAEWVGIHYPDRILLHPRAIRSLKGACYENERLVYQCLKLLATSYYAYRTGSISYRDFVEASALIDPGLNERRAITDVAAGMEGETYFVLYKGRRRKLERHLAKGSNKDRRYCLRIYFFWDAQDQVIVIGDMPHHLSTSAT